MTALDGGSTPRFLVASDRALLAEFPDVDEALRAHVAWTEAPGVTALIPAARTVLVEYDPLQVSAPALTHALMRRERAPLAAAATAAVDVPVRYDGADLADVAAACGVSADEVVRRHLAAHWRVAFTGFAPGFGYLVGDDPVLEAPRRATPRTRVPAGAVGMAGRFTGVYPRASPGGWQLIGTTDAVMWDELREPPALLAPGTAVRFTRADRETVAASSAGTGDAAPWDPEPRGTRWEVVESAFPVLVQDRGRTGSTALGVSSSGVADRTAAADANRAVGNHGRAAVLETLGGAVLRFHTVDGGSVAAVAGAEVSVRRLGSDGTASSPPHGAPFAVDDGDEVHLGMPTRGLRAIVAVRGGVDARPVLGSRATDTLSGLGPRPLLRGDAVAVGDQRAVRTAVDPWPLPRELPAPGDTVVLRITLGPRDDWFDGAAALLTGQPWEVTPRSDRIGARLHGAHPLRRRIPDELPSEGAVTGALQVPPDGQPVLFLPDHPLTGGYPIVGAVVDDDLDLAAQLPPGSLVRFVLA